MSGHLVSKEGFREVALVGLVGGSALLIKALMVGGVI